MKAEILIDVRLNLGNREVALCLQSSAPVVGVVGPSGSGKSTLLRVLAGLERRAVGTVRAAGQNWQGPGLFVPAHQRGVGWVPQEATLFPHMSVRANLGYAAKGGVEEMASWLGVEALLDRAPRFLSGGERQRVALGRALLSKPRLLLLDEPFASLDRQLRARIASELAARCRSAEMPVVLVTHDVMDLQIFGAERWLFEGGRLEREG